MTAPAILDHAVGRPEPRLRRYVAWYAGYDERGGAPSTHRGLPSPYLTLIFTLHEPLRLSRRPDGTTGDAEYEVLLGGLHRTAVLVVHDGRQSGVQVALHPLAARLLFGVPARDLAAIGLEAAEVLGPMAGVVRERLVATSTWAGRFAVLDRFFASRLGRAHLGAAAPAAEVIQAWEQLTRSAGRCRVTDLAAETGWSARHLQNRFRDELGYGPKTVARIVRFDRARRALTTGSLACVAAAHGYADQAHLAREFNDLAGCSPSRWLAEEFAFVQADAASS